MIGFLLQRTSDRFGLSLSLAGGSNIDRVSSRQSKDQGSRVKHSRQLLLRRIQVVGSNRRLGSDLRGPILLLGAKSLGCKRSRVRPARHRSPLNPSPTIFQAPYSLSSARPSSLFLSISSFSVHARASCFSLLRLLTAPFFRKRRPPLSPLHHCHCPKRQPPHSPCAPPPLRLSLARPSSFTRPPPLLSCPSCSTSSLSLSLLHTSSCSIFGRRSIPMMAMAAPRPKSPPSSPDPCGRHRLQLAVDTLHREIGFLEVGALSLDLRLDYTERDLFHSLIIFQQSFPLPPKAHISSRFDAHQQKR
jgi:hypothetical protein